MAPKPSPEVLALQEALAGRYAIQREIGRGGMGVVYLAQEVLLDRPVALKVLRPDLARRGELRERFLREARTAARLSHPHIVPVHAVHEVGDFVLFAMAYMEGETLGERVRARGPLPPREACRVLREVAWALAYAHAQGVVHRDVKPDNVLLHEASGRALVADFGIALAPGAGDVQGTAEFMSPEQARGEPLDGRSDLYSLGVVGYYVLSGQLPFQAAGGPTVPPSMDPLQSAPPLAGVVPGLPPALAAAVDRCLARDPEGRFAGGEALAEALGAVLEEQREVPTALRLFIKQNREAAASLVALEVFPLGMLALAVVLFVLGDGSMGPPAGPMITLSVVLLALASAPVAVLVQMARRLLRAGYGREDLLRAMGDQLAQRRSELASTYGSGPRRLDRWLKGLLAGGLTVHVAGLGWFAFGPWFPGVVEVLVPAMGLAGLTWVGAGVVSAVRYQLRDHLPGQGWLRFWESPLGGALFRVAGVRLEALPAGAPYGPTEVAIGFAAERLFAALPPEQRRAFSELPEVVGRLEADAERVRGSLAELDVLLRDVGPDPTGSLAGDLRDARAAAEGRLREIVAALQTLRVELLRLHAGVGENLEGITLDLGAAKELSEGVSRMLEGSREVERLLGRPAAGAAATPTPA